MESHIIFMKQAKGWIMIRIIAREMNPVAVCEGHGSALLNKTAVTKIVLWQVLRLC